jgi:hypothetical protein
MTEILLSNNSIAIIDEDVKELINENTWRKNKGGYAIRSSTKNSKPKNILMHRFVWEIWHGPIYVGFEIDHINGNRLDNRLSNLRLVTHKENQQNYHASKNNCTSKYKGVHWKKDHNKWRVMCGNIHVGYFEAEEDAALAYNKKAKEMFGDNIPFNKISSV